MNCTAQRAKIMDRYKLTTQHSPYGFCIVYFKANTIDHAARIAMRHAEYIRKKCSLYGYARPTSLVNIKTKREYLKD